MLNVISLRVADKKVSGKSKDEQMAEKKQELEKRLQDVTGQLGNVKKTAKKGKHLISFCRVLYSLDLSLKCARRVMNLVKM